MYIFAPPRSPLRWLGHVIAAVSPLALGVVIVVQTGLARATTVALWTSRIALGAAFVNLSLSYILVFVLRHSAAHPLDERGGSAPVPPPVLEQPRHASSSTSLGVLVFPVAAIALLELGTPTVSRTFIAYTCLTIGVAANVLALMLAPTAEHPAESSGKWQRPATPAPAARTSSPPVEATAALARRQRQKRRPAGQSTAPESAS